MKRRVIVIGGGAAGCMAAYQAARAGANVTVLESTPRLMNKVRITGKGRCNLTNACETEAFLSHIVHNPRFFRSAYARFDNQALMARFEAWGVALKTERGQRVFPQSDNAHEIADALAAALKRAGVTVCLKTKARALRQENGRILAVDCAHGMTVPGDAFIIATGGLSYPVTGSTGDGYELAGQAGHTIVPPQPSLCPIEVKEPWVGQVAGLSLKNVALKVYSKGKKVFDEQGELLFTHKGLSGPLALSASAHLDRDSWAVSRMTLDWKPALDEGQLKQRLIREVQFAPNREAKTLMWQLVPKHMAPILLALAGIEETMPCHEMTKQQRAALIAQLKGTSFDVSKVGPMEAAIVTRGGVSVKQVDPGTLGSRLAKNLFFAGEVLDLDAYTGGYNLQIAFSTGAAAGAAAAKAAE